MKSKDPTSAKLAQLSINISTSTTKQSHYSHLNPNIRKRGKRFGFMPLKLMKKESNSDRVLQRNQAQEPITYKFDKNSRFSTCLSFLFFYEIKNIFFSLQYFSLGHY